MKKIVQIFLVLLFHFSYSQQNCENFNANTGNWKTVAAGIGISTNIPMSNNTPYMRGTDAAGSSRIFNTTYGGNLGANGGTCFCWDYKVFNDGFVNSISQIHPRITIYQGNVVNPTLSASYIANITITENSNWVRICAAPILPSTTALPSDANGAWVMAGGVGNWNALIANVTGVLFNTDVAGSPFQTEVLGIDNFCSNNCCNINASPNFTMTTSCNNGNFCVTATASDLTAGNHGWSLYEMVVAGGGTSDANTVLPPVQSQSGGTSVTFCGLDPSKSYYIKHGIWDTCYQWRETRKEVEKFKADAIFNFETADGTVKTEFCYGEDVFMDGTASYGENRYYIDVWRRPKGSTQNFAWYAGLGWTLNAQVGVINLTQALANLNPAKDLELAYEYKVKLAIANLDNCIPWTPVEHTFTFKCCDNGTINADFTGVIRTTGEVEVYDFDVFSNINAVHEWYVLSSPNHAAGPYTPVYSGTSTGAYTSANPLTLINNAQSGLYYTVIHKIKTDCGDICVSQELFFDKFQKAVAQDAVDACCLAFEYWPNGPGTPATFTADFDGDINSNGTLFVENFETYANANATHEWYVYSSPTPNGPYTHVTTVTSTTQVTVNLLNNVQSGIYYTIIHKVITDCLTECLDKAFWYNGNVLSEAPSGNAKASEKLPDPCCIANPVIITANGVDITDTKTYTIPCGKSGVIIHATNLENVQYTSPDPVLFGGGSFAVPNGYPYSNFIVYITGIDSCGNKYSESLHIKINQCCLPAPTNVHLHVYTSVTYLHWDPVPGAVGYIVSPSMVWNITCTCKNPVSINPIETTVNYTTLPVAEGKCFMVRVAAICANGEISPYSQDICVGGTGKGGVKGTDGAVVTGAKQLREVSITPNPTKGEMTFNIMANADIEVNVDIYDTYGTLIKSFVQKVTSDKASTISWDGSNLRKGIYFVNFRTKEETIYKQVIVK